VVGNHEFNYGLGWIEGSRRASRFPWLAANVLGRDGKPLFEPYLQVERGRKRIAILAITTPQVPRWEAPQHIAGLTFVDAVETARAWVPRLRREADAVVVAAHMGWSGVTDGGTELPVPPENDVERMLREVPGIDALLMAHTHELIAQRRGALGTPAVQAAWGGLALGEASFDWRGAELSVGTRVHETNEATAPDPTILSVAAPHEEKARVWGETVVGEASGAFTTDGARYRDNAILTLLHRAQREATGAELSSAALFYADRTIRAGTVRALDLFRIYPFENFLTVVEMTVDDVRGYLEEIARIYVAPASGGELPAIDPRITLYNHDSLAGCEYVIDPGRPAGRRVVHLTFDREERGGDRRVQLALSSYRALGGGGYQTLKRARIVEVSDRETRSVLVDYVRRRGRIAPEVDDNWRVIGATD
jgi:2',3'-cyclic-nucleotide 2'-phosphodiesterase/3'-nucleotidase